MRLDPIGLWMIASTAGLTASIIGNFWAMRAMRGLRNEVNAWADRTQSVMLDWIADNQPERIVRVPAEHQGRPELPIGGMPEGDKYRDN